MKKLLVVCFLALVFGANSQEINYNSIRKIVSETYPEIDLSNKLLAISVWNSANKESREQNKEFLRSYETYKQAKLKGGLKGVVFISVSSDDNKTLFDIAKQKDVATYNYVVCDFNGYSLNGKLANMGINNGNSNLVFDNNGNLVYQNVTTDAIFKSFNTLITR